MCGIVGYLGHEGAAPVLVEGLKKLEYRGYDSAGIAVVSEQGLQVRRSAGRLAELEKVLAEKPVQGRVGIGHTRWATHGRPTAANAHPHVDYLGKTAVVHNGIIENHAALKEKLLQKGVQFQSETDTEVVAQLIGLHWDALLKANGRGFEEIFVLAVQRALRELEGTYALGVVSAYCPDRMIVARRECPLLVGLAGDATLVASDATAILSRTRDVIYLEDGDMAVLGARRPLIMKNGEQSAQRSVVRIDWDSQGAEKKHFPHFMLKEIYEQPQVAADTLEGRLKKGRVELEDAVLTEKQARSLTHVHLVACGTSWHAALVGSYWVEKFTGLPCQAAVASEFRYRNPPLNEKSLVVALSQSGETADTLAAVRLARKAGAPVVAVSNVAGSSLAREADGCVLTRCGPEIGVAATKSFLGQLIVMKLLALHLAGQRGALPKERGEYVTDPLARLPQEIAEALACDAQMKELAVRYAERPSFIFLGRHINYPLALEGALKLKEISYIHAEGYAAGEMKHGPIALIDENVPVVVIAPSDFLFDKSLSNLEQVIARGGRVILISDEQGVKRAGRLASHSICLPTVDPFVVPIIAAIPVQLLAYHAAVLKGTDVDQPRNLAKSVTVE